jgi:hypothetical protein
VRLDSVGTARLVRLGTEAFARPIEWFGLDECEMTPQGLRTPAVERIIRSRRTPPPRRIAFGQSDPEPAPEQRTDPARRLAAALQSGSVPAVASLYRDITASHPDQSSVSEALAAVLEEARSWLETQAELRRELFDQLDQALQDRKSNSVRTLLARVYAMARSDRSRHEDDIARDAALFLEEQKRTARWEHRDAEQAARSARTRRSRVYRAVPPSARRYPPVPSRSPSGCTHA